MKIIDVSAIAVLTQLSRKATSTYLGTLASTMPGLLAQSAGPVVAGATDGHISLDVLQRDESRALLHMAVCPIHGLHFDSSSVKPCWKVFPKDSTGSFHMNLVRPAAARRE